MQPLIPGLGALLLGGTCLSAATPTLTVNAGDHERLHSIVTAQLPQGTPKIHALRGPDGRQLPAQHEPDGRFTFILPHLAPGTQLTFQLLSGPGADPAPAPARAVRDGKQIRFASQDPAPLTYQAEPSQVPRDGIDPVYRRGAYLHPIRSPSGAVVSDDYPHNHLHHHGIWFAWTKTEFQGRHPDFWNMGQKLGTVEFDRLLDHWDGSVHAGFRSRHVHRDLTAPDRPPALFETWEVRHYPHPATRDAVNRFDIVVRQECASDSPLILPSYHYGGLGFRGHADWDGAANCHYLTSDGVTDRIKAHATRGRWCYIGGSLDGRQAGIVILCHPDNFRAPQPMRIHPTEPFFCFAPQQLGDMSIEPGQPYLSRYRCLVVEGPPDKERFEAWYNDYAQPPVLTLTP